ncbi:hypothetical protein OH492_06615 [Vibrio chagasii]|nr:hypothetical protein [Vibrio chagasii]
MVCHDSKLETAKLVEQLALNSVLYQEDTSITLTSRSSQAHLNTDRAQSELLQAVSEWYRRRVSL